MAGPKLPRNERLQNDKGQVDQRFLRYWDQIKTRAFDALPGFAKLTSSATIDPAADFLPLYDTSEGVTRKVLVQDISATSSPATVTTLTTADSTYTPPADCVWCWFKIQGAGAKGRAGNTNSSPTVLYGGGCGSYAEVIIAASSISSGVSVSIGAQNSETATVVSFPSNTVTVPAAVANGSSTPAGAVTGIVDFSVQGAPGHNSGAANASAPPGYGRDSFMGRGGSQDHQSNASGYGAGGASGENSASPGDRTAGDGTDGAIVVFEFY